MRKGFWKQEEEMGFTAFNTSISWARIMPKGIEGEVNQEGVEFKSFPMISSEFPL